MDEQVHDAHSTKPLLYKPFHTDQLIFEPFKHTDEVIHDLLNASHMWTTTFDVITFKWLTYHKKQTVAVL